MEPLPKQDCFSCFLQLALWFVFFWKRRQGLKRGPPLATGWWAAEVTGQSPEPPKES